MTTYRVHLTSVASASLTVEAEDRADAIDQALEQGVPEICAQCSGWGRDWSREIGDEWDVDEVTDADGNEVKE